MNFSERIRLVLLEEFVKAQTRNSKYSMRSYAKKLGVSQSSISEMLSGKRSITRKSAAKILRGLEKDPNEVMTILSTADNSAEPKFQPIDMDSFHVIADWHHFAILNLVHTKDFQSSAQWISKRLGISEKAAEDSIDKLLRLDLLTKDRAGNLKPTDQQFEVISKVASPALRKANSQNLELATKALQEVSLDLRDFTAMTLCLDPERIEDARKMIKNFRRHFNRVMEAGHKKEVYKLCVQLFPLSHRGLE